MFSGRAQINFLGLIEPRTPRMVQSRLKNLDSSAHVVLNFQSIAGHKSASSTWPPWQWLSLSTQMMQSQIPFRFLALYIYWFIYILFLFCFAFPYTSISLFLINYLYELKHFLLTRAFYLAFKKNSKPWCLWVWFPKISIMLLIRAF